MVIFINEAAKNNKTVARNNGWSFIGTRVIQRQVFVRGKTWSILPVMMKDGIVAYDIIQGTVTSGKFLGFLKEHVVCVAHFLCLDVHIP
ncbi:hypothetical protein C8J56DRAFT_793392 [Mycena floridula]|nr:hypothetical protein C8J56DRAFT_793392 [Mycena floridula]